MYIQATEKAVFFFSLSLFYLGLKALAPLLMAQKLFSRLFTAGESTDTTGRQTYQPGLTCTFYYYMMSVRRGRRNGVALQTTRSLRTCVSSEVISLAKLTFSCQCSRAQTIIAPCIHPHPSKNSFQCNTFRHPARMAHLGN